MADELKDQRVVTMMSSSELEAIDNWMFANRIRSRGEAIRRLCRIGVVSAQGLKEIFDLEMALAETRLKIEGRGVNLEEERALNLVRLKVTEIASQAEALEKGAANFEEAMEIAESNRDRVRRAIAASEAVFEKHNSEFTGKGDKPGK